MKIVLNDPRIHSYFTYSFSKRAQTLLIMINFDNYDSFVKKFTNKHRRKVGRVSCPIFPFRPSRRQHDPKILMRSCVDLCTHKLFIFPSYYNYTCFPFTNHSENFLPRAYHVATSSLIMFSNAISTDFPQLHSFGSALFLCQLISYVRKCFFLMAAQNFVLALKLEEIKL